MGISETLLVFEERAGAYRRSEGQVHQCLPGACGLSGLLLCGHCGRTGRLRQGLQSSARHALFSPWEWSSLANLKHSIQRGILLNITHL